MTKKEFKEAMLRGLGRCVLAAVRRWRNATVAGCDIY